MAAMTEELRPSEQLPKNGAPKMLCEECNSIEFKYKCPACSRRTCSLSCVNSHKQLSGCTGKKTLSKVIPLSQFNDSTLLSDYNLLEDVKRVADSAQRMRVKLCGNHPQFKLPYHLKALRGAAMKKGTKLLLLPNGMARREKNQTRYNQRKKNISWTIEWRFHSTDVVLLEHGVHESTTLRSVIEKHLQPSPWRNKLRRFCEESLDNLKLFIRKYHKGNKAPYRKLDLDTPLYHLFGGLVILEYPVICVFLPTDSYDFEVVKDVRPPPSQRDSKRPDKVDVASPLGVTFREEDIKEDGTVSEPQIIDLLKSSEVDTLKPNTLSVQMINKQSNDSPNKFTKLEIESDVIFSDEFGKEVEMLDAKIEDLDFDQELIDAYSYLMDECNPDNFLNLKPEGEADDHVVTNVSNVYFTDLEELEEGEIPNSE